MPVIQDPQEVTIRDGGTVVLPISLLAQAGLNPGEKIMAASTDDGRIVLRHLTDAIDDLLSGRPL
ncbi:hypothetical protein AB0K95_16760 [Streptomyces werraensis]|uniref:SpoVT-AbrB domain-containing protein n=1 Tax=Streptomyces werraensis TaxID=68284 RepID=A0ABV3JH31_9ACTN